MPRQPRLLLVDDEEGIRVTLALMLQSHGFEITAAATVPEALRLISQEKFDVLIADLNVGHPGDGFTIVSAMRRTQPDAATFILTGYPGFDSALEAIRQQVDDYLVKPTDIDSLVQKVRAGLEKKRVPRTPLKRLTDIVEENRDSIVRDWLAEVKKDPELAAIPMSDAERTDHLPRVLDEGLSRARGAELTVEDARAAALHGRTRRQQGYSVPFLIREAKILQVVIGTCVQQNLLSVLVSHVIPDMVRITETIETELEASVRAFLATRKSPTPAAQSRAASRNKKLNRNKRAA